MIIIDLSSLASLGSTTTTSSNDGIYLSKNDIATTLTSTISTASTSGAPGVVIYADTARSYVSSMSEQEIDELLLQIDEQETKLSNEIEIPKVKKLELNHDKKV